VFKPNKLFCTWFTRMVDNISSTFNVSSLLTDLKGIIQTLPKSPEEIKSFLQTTIKNAQNGKRHPTTETPNPHDCSEDKCPLFCHKTTSSQDKLTTTGITRNVGTRREIFRHPIEYVPTNDLHTLPRSIIDDLELLHKKEQQTALNEDSSTTPSVGLYANVFNPQTIFANHYLYQWSKYYTTNIDYLKDTQLLFKLHSEKNVDGTLCLVKECAEIDTAWSDIKCNGNVSEFRERFSYIDVPILEKLNSSPHVLQLVSVYNISSPLLALATPIFVLILPFFILKLRGFELTVSSYIDVLKQIMSNHAIGKLFTQFDEVSWSQRLYILVSVFFYFMQIYQNVMACRRFYKNMYLIHDHIILVNTYLKATARNIRYVTSLTSSLHSYTAFREELMNRFKRISEVTATLDCITPFSVSFSKFTQVGVVMKKYYEFFASEDLDELIHYSFGLNAYLEHVGECGLLIKEGLLNQCTFDTSNEDETEDGVTDSESKADDEDEDDNEDGNEDGNEHGDEHGNEDEAEDGEQDDVTKDNRKSITHFTNQYYAPLMRKSPVKNDISLKKQVIITGPNAAGKTTIIKSTLFNIILSQQIGYGFYDTANIIPYHYLHCYLNIPDTSGRDSLFQAESRRCKEIITCLTSNSDKRHFCIFDELYSGTNPYEAVAAAYGYIHYLSKMPNVDLMLTTHYIELCHLLSEHDRIDNLHMEALINDNFDLTYLYKVAKGVSTIKGGMKVLHDLEYPREVIDAATDILTKPRK